MSEHMIRLQTQLVCSAWKLRRVALLRGMQPALFRAEDRSHWLVVSGLDNNSAAQTFPLFYYAGTLGKKFGIGIREILLPHFLERAALPPWRGRSLLSNLVRLGPPTHAGFGG